MKSIKAALLIGAISFIIIVTVTCAPPSPSVLPPAQTTTVSNPPPPSVTVDPTKPVPAEPSLPKESLFLEKINSVPDYAQLDSAYGGLPGKGTEYCGPANVSNVLMWLSENGFPNLSPRTGDRKKDQFDVIYTLGLPQYMDTGLKGTSSVGTTPTELCRGLKQYILDKGYKYKRIEYQGWRIIPPEFDTKVRIPDLKWLRQGIQGHGGAFMGIGYYNYDSATDEYKRIDGHWLTFVGYGHDGKAINLQTLIVHNSATPANYQKNEYLIPEMINTGMLTGGNPGLPHSAQGFYKIKVLGMPKTADFAIFDYAVILEMQP